LPRSAVPSTDVTFPSIRADHLWKAYRVYKTRATTLKEYALARRSKYDELWALKDVSFEVGPGEMLGVIGPNGSGKSTLLKMLAKVLGPDAGELTINGRVAALLELGIGFHPDLSGRDNVYLSASLLGMTQEYIDRRYDEIIDFAGLWDFVDMPIKDYSSGMVARLAFATAISVDADILLVDEVLAVGDADFQIRCLERIAEMRRQERVVVFVSHSLDAIRTLCSSAIWLDKGKVRANGNPDDVADVYINEVRRHRSEEQGEPMDTSGSRWGNGKALINDVWFEDAEGRRTSQLVAGEPCRLRIAWECREPLSDVRVAVAISKIEGEHVIQLESRRFQNLKSLSVGTGILDYDMLALPLASGPYRMSVTICDTPAVTFYDFRHREFSLTVFPGKNEGAGGVAYAAGSWQLTKDAGLSAS
jgi:ABC-type polysaccharide/polyol phosphate transport system ATPase subunit